MITLQNIEINGRRFLRLPPDPEFPMFLIGTGSLIELSESDWEEAKKIQEDWNSLQIILRTSGIFLDAK